MIKEKVWDALCCGPMNQFQERFEKALGEINLLERYFYLEGQRNMAWDLAVWENGYPLVGVMKTPYEDFIRKLDQEQMDIRAKIGMTDCQIKGCTGCPDCGPSHVEIPESDLEEYQ